MKLGIMQPYLFPYIGYYQLISAVDEFVNYDDVAFIQQGWINRNRVKINGEARYFTVPLAAASSFRSIRETMVATVPYEAFRRKFFATISTVYSKAPFYLEIRNLLEGVFVRQPASIGELAWQSVSVVCSYLRLQTRLVPSSTIFGNSNLKRADRLIDICRREGADTYINAIGGTELYSRDEFAMAGITLRFLHSGPVEYSQCDRRAFIPNLSIIDVLMFNSREQLSLMLQNFKVVDAGDLSKRQAPSL
jgi:hypothetical protein